MVMMKVMATNYGASGCSEKNDVYGGDNDGGIELWY